MARSGGLGARLYRGEVSYNIVGRKKFWYSVSAGLIVLALVGLLVRGLNLGIEFKGGAEFYVPSASCEIQEVREAVASTGVEPAASAHRSDAQTRCALRVIPNNPINAAGAIIESSSTGSAGSRYGSRAARVKAAPNRNAGRRA